MTLLSILVRFPTYYWFRCHYPLITYPRVDVLPYIGGWILPFPLSCFKDKTKGFIPFIIRAEFRQESTQKKCLWMGRWSVDRKILFQIFEVFLWQTCLKKILQALTLKWRIVSQPAKIGSGKNGKSLFFLLSLKITLRTCFESNNFLSNSCPELSNQELSFPEGQIYK